MNVTKPLRVTRSYTQQLAATPAQVFPLLCPVREADWIDGWDPELVLSESGFAEPDCVFVTAASPLCAVWYITRHESDAGFVEMIKIIPTVTASRLRIQLRAVALGSEATIIYTHTSLGPEGDAFVASFTEDYYRQFMQNWEIRLNTYLTSGTTLRDAHI